MGVTQGRGEDDPQPADGGGGGGGGGAPETDTLTMLLWPLELEVPPHCFVARTSKRSVAPASAEAALSVSVVPPVVPAAVQPSPPLFERDTT